MNNENYKWFNYHGAWKSLHHIIELYQDATVVEVGIFRAECVCSLLSHCPSIKKVIGVDNWKPHTDYKYEQFGEYIDNKSLELARLTAYHNIQYCDDAAKIEILELDSIQASTKFLDRSVDFVLLDSYMSYDDMMQQVLAWMPKVKFNGYIAGHDSTTECVQNGITTLQHHKKMHISLYDNVWIGKVI